MAQFNVHEAKTRLSQLLARAEAGEKIVIARAGKPSVRLVADVGDHGQTTKPRVFGQLAGQAWIAPDFDAHDAEIERLFSGSHPDATVIEDAPPKSADRSDAR